ncbi:MAG: protein-L-isoaspartate(D-aspartate) O-methyltransferase [Pirellulaceae bacterium]|nr:protein-L-isoaspartate(D-aspartate) O-methyltransferase [Planctomycetales bacterium]MCA9265571.1 protein-L-isoaspartate(D-aspartate) O-methyltransferase [Planctomycetales bacterium]
MTHQVADPHSFPGNSFTDERRQMVENHLRRRGIDDARVLWAMGEVPRELFVPDVQRDEAYCDGALPIGYGQTISQPYTVAYMCQAAQLHGEERVLEVGTGSGYGAAVLGMLAREVHTVERIARLAQRAEQTLQSLGLDHVVVHLGDGSEGWSAAAPYDAIIVTAAAERLPFAYQEQLADGGRLIIPIGPHGQTQRLCRFTREGNALTKEDLGAFVFVPLVSPT